MGQQDEKKLPFWDESLTTEERLDWLLGAMTLEEKLKCLATKVPDIESLGIKGFGVGGEAAHGVEARNDQNELGAAEPTTSFTQPIGMSATWDTELVKKAGEVTGKEARVIYHRHPDRGLSRWAPTVDLERDPRWGRTEEGYGEDPLLTGAMSDTPEVVEAAAKEAFDLKLITEEDVDTALRNMFRTKLRLGIYDAKNSNPYDLVTEEDINSEENQRICRQVSREAIVLLKNDNECFPFQGKRIPWQSSDRLQTYGTRTGMGGNRLLRKP